MGVQVVMVMVMLLIQLPAIAQEQQKVTINFLNGWTGDRIALVDEVIRRFEARYPWIEVQSQVVDPPALGEKLTVAVLGNAAPDLTMVSFPDSIRLGQQGFLKPLGNLVQKEGLKLNQHFYPPILEQLANHPMAGKGNFYFLPQLIETSWFLYYNIDHFNDSGISLQQVPQTWAQLEQISRRLSRPAADGSFDRLGIDVAMYRISGPYRQWLAAGGGYGYSEDLRRIILGEPKAYGLQTLDWIVKFTNEVNKGLANQEKLSNGGRTGFYAKQFSMLIDGSSATFQIESKAPDIDFGMAELPHRDGFDFRPNMGLGWGYGIPENAPHPDEAWLFLKFLTMEVEGGGYFVLQQGRPGATMQINNQRQFAETNPYWPVIQANLNRSVSGTPTPPITTADTLQRGMVREAVTGEFSPQAALDRAVTKWQNDLDAFWAAEKR